MTEKLEKPYFDEAEVDVIKKMMRDANDAAREAIRLRQLSVHPRILAARAAGANI